MASATPRLRRVKNKFPKVQLHEVSIKLKITKRLSSLIVCRIPAEIKRRTLCSSCKINFFVVLQQVGEDFFRNREKKQLAALALNRIMGSEKCDAARIDRLFSDDDAKATTGWENRSSHDKNTMLCLLYGML